MNRRTMLQAFVAAGADVIAASARADETETVVTYRGRLEARLSDGGGGAFLSAEEDQLLPLHNAFRRAQGLGPLQRDADLDRAARAHVADLLMRKYFDHVSPEGFSAEQRVGLLARRFLGASGENLASEEGGGVRPTAKAFTQLWRDSPGHRANILRQSFTHVGFGVVASRQSTIASAVFGQTYGELRAPAPFWIGRGGGLAGVLTGVSQDLIGYELAPLDGGGAVGSFTPQETPSSLEPGPYTIRPHVSDPVTPRRYWILYGPIVVAA